MLRPGKRPLGATAHASRCADGRLTGRAQTRSHVSHPIPFDVAALRRADDTIAALDAALADDVEWVEIDQRTQPHAPSVARGRETVIAGIRAAHARGLVSKVTDGFASGDRAAFTVVCTYPTGEQVTCNALADISDGKITRWVGVQAWDE